MKGIVSWAVPYNINPKCNKKKDGDLWIKNCLVKIFSRLLFIFFQRDFHNFLVDVPK